MRAILKRNGNEHWTTAWLSFAIVFVTLDVSNSQDDVFVKNVAVQQESPLDWRYAAYQDSEKKDLNAGMKQYSSVGRRYDLFGPSVAPAEQLPLILFISPGDSPTEWEQFERTCKKHGVLFAGLRDAGNAHSTDVRIRAALDVLSDVRRLYRVDPDRTYVAGFSGGATVACRLALTLPENFGGLICIGQRIQKLRHAALVDRASERVSIAALCGARERVGPEVEFIDQPICQAMGFRCRCFVSRRGRHKMPKAGVIELAFRWLDEDVESRRKLAQRYPGTRIDTKRQFATKRWRKSLLNEGTARREAGRNRSALALWRWIEERWPDSEEAKLAAHQADHLEQNPKVIAAQAATVSKLDLELEQIVVKGYEKLALNRQGTVPPGLQATFARLAIRQMEYAQYGIERKKERIEKLQAIAQGK